MTGPDRVAANATTIPAVRLEAATEFRAYSGVDSRERLVVRDAATWNALWARMAARRMPAPPVPEVDFAREMLIVVAVGSRPTGGYTIEVERTSAAGDDLFVEVLSRTPARQCLTTQALTQPLDVVRVARRPGPVHFVERTGENGCP